MFVGMWMSRDPITVVPTTSLQIAARIMADRRIRRLPVLENADHDSKLVGIVSSTDVLHAVPLSINPFAPVTDTGKPRPETITSSDVLVQDIMTRDPLTILPEAPIENAAALLRDRKIGALPVVRQERLLGLITESDVFRAFTQLFDLSASGARITFDITAREDILPFVAQTASKHGLRVTSFVSLQESERPMCVVHVAGDAIDAMLEEVWRSHHRVASVLRSPEVGMECNSDL